VEDLETLQYEEVGPVAVVTLNRPEVHNAFNLRMQEELRRVWLDLRANDDVNAVVLTGAGEKAFCTGIDRKEAIGDHAEDAVATPAAARSGRVSSPFMFNDPGEYLNPKANDLWKPVIAAVNGMACGGAFYMLGESDLIIAAEHATFFDPHVSYGMVAGFETVHMLQRLPIGETLRIALLGVTERMSAGRAHQLGLVSEIVAADRLRDRAVELGQVIASAPPLAVQGTVRAAWLAQETLRRDALMQVSTIVSAGTSVENIAAGQAAFNGVRQEPTIR
jgi:enoyl-CoA hydratase/carnithine racemase